jgi:hypothetical protein
LYSFLFEVFFYINDNKVLAINYLLQRKMSIMIWRNITFFQFVVVMTMLGSVIFCSPLWAFSDVHFFRAAPLFKEPRLERSFLSSFDIWLGGGRAKQSFNKDNKKVALFDLWGTHNMQELGNGVCESFSDPLDLLLIQLSLLPGRDLFANFSIQGHFGLIEGGFRFTQNFIKGFFFEFYMPIRSFKVSDIAFIDLSPTDAAFPNNKNPIWIAFQNNFTKILARYGLSDTFPLTTTGVGDMAFLLGWTYSYQETTELDFIDVTVQTGVVMPAAKKKNEDELFSLPLGYNGHWAVPIRGVGAIGIYEWLTIGAALEATFFVPRGFDMRMKTGARQSGIIKLEKGFANVEKGTLWLANVFVKGDHVVRGFSLGFGYTYAQERTSYVTPTDSFTFSYPIVNSDALFDGFIQQTLHAYVEYDFTESDWKYGPRIGLAYNHPVTGKHIFRTALTQATFGLEVVWDY